MLKKLLSFAVISLALAGCNKTGAGETDKIKYSYSLQDKPAPTVILAHGCNGVGKWDSQWKDTLTDWGYNVVIVDSFTQRGLTSGVCGWGSASAHPKVRAQDMLDVANYVKTQSWHRGGVGVLGMSHGGATSVALSVRQDAKGVIDANIALYPGCILLTSIFGERPQIPTQIHLGGADEWTPCTHWGFEKQGYAEGDNSVFIYPNAPHAFDLYIPGGMKTLTSATGQTFRYGYHDASAKALTPRVKEYFAKHLNK